MTPQQANEQLNILERILEWTEKYSIKHILKAVVMLWFIVFTLTFSFSPSTILNKYAKWNEYVHNQKIEKRLQISPKIQAEIERILLRTNATRATILECHNSNINGVGIPFYYADVTYECVRGVPFVAEYYRDFSISRYTLLPYVYKNHYFAGNIEQVKKIDERLAIEMPLNSSQYIIIYSLPNKCGFLAITYNNPDNVNLDRDRREIELIFNKIVKIFNE